MVRRPRYRRVEKLALRPQCGEAKLRDSGVRAAIDGRAFMPAMAAGSAPALVT